jgi:hypothetical protein
VIPPDHNRPGIDQGFERLEPMIFELLELTVYPVMTPIIAIRH